MTMAKMANAVRRDLDFRLPDEEKRPDEKMTSNRELADTGHQHHLKRRLGNYATTLVRGDMALARYVGDKYPLYPDLIVARDVDLALFERQNGYVIKDQGKPPDFVLEIASRSTGRRDIEEKHGLYEEMFVPEYWTFDRAGAFHGMRLAGRNLIDRRYVFLPIAEIEEDVLEGTSSRLDVNLRWDHGDLAWHDPRTGLHIATYDSLEADRSREMNARLRAEADRSREMNDRLQAEADRNREMNARLRAEAERDREIEARLRAEAENERLRRLLSGS